MDELGFEADVKFPCDLSKLDEKKLCHDHCVKSINYNEDCKKYEEEVKLLLTPDEIFAYYKSFVKHFLDRFVHEVKIVKFQKFNN